MTVVVGSLVSDYVLAYTILQARNQVKDRKPEFHHHMDLEARITIMALLLVKNKYAD